MYIYICVCDRINVKLRVTEKLCLIDFSNSQLYIYMCVCVCVCACACVCVCVCGGGGGGEGRYFSTLTLKNLLRDTLQKVVKKLKCTQQSFVYLVGSCDYQHLVHGDPRP